MTAKKNKPKLCGPCDHCGASVSHEDPGGSPYTLLCEKCEAELGGYPHPPAKLCLKCIGLPVDGGCDSNARPRVETDDDRFGLCPVCHKTDGYINIGRGHWFYCKEHKGKWFIGSNLFSSWQDETETEQRRIFDELGAGAFEDVEPYYLPALAREPGATLPADDEAPL